jgi:hypothetical protein
VDCLHFSFDRFYEKVIKIKADVAAVLVSTTQRFGEWWWTLSRAPFLGVHLDP